MFVSVSKRTRALSKFIVSKKSNVTLGHENTNYSNVGFNVCLQWIISFYDTASTAAAQLTEIFFGWYCNICNYWNVEND